ncbi:adaptin N terminal region-domain-containing protein [Zychaea mexicana]|uniref:adaptin N terminal region-domain-containing protein n=1 Tax=Zychaea mexicana TaxID=64656 RepID=UPI0022FE72B6|nr:adaptin N terminal region-domain-containing protein [Zychaea mexicana]KAI9493443.1 adaptin N terminal region-domain-containing protein [Zychaea mexicana]
MSQGLVDNAREFGFPAAGDSGAQYFDTSEEKMRNIKRQLDSRNDREKLDGLKRLIANVVSQNIEVRKLVYIYLLRYAEQEPDLALLSINSFQKDLSDKNQIIRAMALRVMSGIRVPVISPIVLLGIKKCSTDSSAYVRKAAAHAIPKCYSLDASQKDAIIEIIASLLKDRSTITIGSTIMAFNEVCPNRFDLIHPCFRKLCGLLADCDEWGQMAILGVMLRYGRSQFLNPNPHASDQLREPPKTLAVVKHDDRHFYTDSESEDSVAENGTEADDVVQLDEDHELLLKSCIPLLQSRNSGVVLAVARLFYHLAPAAEAQKIARPLVRLLRNHREMQYVVLKNIAIMATSRPYLFEPYIQQFYVRSAEPVFIRDIKLDILTSICSESNIYTLLNEFQQYVKSPNKDFVAATIQAIGRCATNVSAGTDRCMRLLMKLLHSTNELVVAESVIVVTRLLQTCNEDRLKSVIALAKLLDSIHVPMARANIIWLIGQHAETLPKVGPDVLRQAVKSFIAETNIAKLQVLTLSAKLICLNPSHPTLNTLNQYVLNLARYDPSYDVRDRARFLRALTIPQHNQEQQHPGLTALKEHAKRILFSDKEPPALEGEVGTEYIIGTLSLLANQALPDYEPLSDYPEEQPDPSVRDVEELEGWAGSRTMVLEQGFGSDSFESRYRDPSMASTALSGIEATGFHGGYAGGAAKKKGNDYDLDAFYEDTTDEYDDSSEEDGDSNEEEDSSDEEDYTDDDDESEESEEEEDSSSGPDEHHHPSPPQRSKLQGFS